MIKAEQVSSWQKRSFHHCVQSRISTLESPLFQTAADFLSRPQVDFNENAELTDKKLFREKGTDIKTEQLVFKNEHFEGDLPVILLQVNFIHVLITL